MIGTPVVARRKVRPVTSPDVERIAYLAALTVQGEDARDERNALIRAEVERRRGSAERTHAIDNLVQEWRGVIEARDDLTDDQKSRAVLSNNAVGKILRGDRG